MGAPNLDSALGSVLLSHRGQLSGEQLFADSKTPSSPFLSEMWVGSAGARGQQEVGEVDFGEVEGSALSPDPGTAFGER